MQRWDYKILYRARGWETYTAGKTAATAGEWDYFSEDDIEIPIIKDMSRKIKDLGNQGWELVEIVPRSSKFGGLASFDYAGLTTGELWVFKRPLP